MTPRRVLSWLWNGLTLICLLAAFVVHRDAGRAVADHARASAAAEARAARRATVEAWTAATARAVPTARRWIRAVAPSPPSAPPAEVASGAADGTVRFHAGVTGEIVRSWPSWHDRAVTALAWADGALVSADSSGAVRVADPSSGTLRWDTHTGQEVIAVGVDPARDAVIAVGRDGRRTRWALSTGVALGGASASPYAILAFDTDLRDGAIAWAAVGGNLRAWDAWTDARVGRSRVDATRRIDALSIDLARGRAALARRDGVLSIWDTETGAALLEWTEEAPVTCLAFSPDGALLVAGGADGVVRRFDARTGRPVGSMKATGDQLATLRFAADGARLYAGGRRGVLHVFSRGTP